MPGTRRHARALVSLWLAKFNDFALDRAVPFKIALMYPLKLRFLKFQYNNNKLCGSYFSSVPCLPYKSALIGQTYNKRLQGTICKEKTTYSQVYFLSVQLIKQWQFRDFMTINAMKVTAMVSRLLSTFCACFSYGHSGVAKCEQGCHMNQGLNINWHLPPLFYMRTHKCNIIFDRKCIQGSIVYQLCCLTHKPAKIRIVW